ncbi:alanyl-tRNA synthetase [Desulfonauticus submarinus]|uniref:Alanine--tRNA ligase n=1 Tax=Desulfonauticus submarinus TaxID=206665 RepID=A0A1H0C1K5_9BACT|nr:alanine--tRNA ligase [Desulfonauticus submarinus]SDN51761.1 alanyl-tRNA synthetase [Desulfonauticus submarinus]
MLKSKEIRRKFLEFFAKNGHTIVPSSSLIPKDDPTLLFTNAGMVQFKKVFLGQEKREYVRATTAQKCLRVGGKHNDLENVGRTARHHTFFEMLGNFSFGDYFKKDAIKFAWEFLTKELGLDPLKLYITVYKDDEEAISLWQQVAGVPKERIFRLGEKDNFWSMGDTGPCGPCSEILYDQGENLACGPNCGIGKCDCDRYLEIWNLVFMQYNRDEEGNLNPLPRPSIDTGMGLERISAVCQGVYSNFDSDLFTGIIDALCHKARVEYKADPEIDTALRVIADHLRAMAFMIADGILPSNEGRGYVLRRLIRRAFRFGRVLGFYEPFLNEFLTVVVHEMGEAYPELKESESFASEVILKEEERFAKTLDKGLKILEEALLSLEKSGQKMIGGEVVFRLYDTYGFPIDIVNDIAEKRGFKVDEKGFKQFMEEQKQRAKAAWKGSGEKDIATQFRTLLGKDFKVEFKGYDTLKSQGKILCLLNERGKEVKELSTGEKGFLLSDKTPFYGESGGQVGDTGIIKGENALVSVLTTLKPVKDLIVHQVEVVKGAVQQGEQISLEVQEGVRIATARNHTATHLLHAALRRVLGDHVKQAGSLVEPTRLRFDFTHIKALTPDELKQVEEEVNKVILTGLNVQTDIMEYEQAVKMGAMALFGEKYDQKVRVVKIGDFSIELCGGTHLNNTSQIGLFLIVNEEAVAAGVRRIEALTGTYAYKHVVSLKEILLSAQEELEVNFRQIPEKIKSLIKEYKTLLKENKRLEQKFASDQGKNLLSKKETLSGIDVLAVKVEIEDVGALRKLMDDLRSKMSSGIILLAAAKQGKANLLLSVSKDLHSKFTAPQLIKQVAKEVGGGGGGRPDLAQAGGPLGDKLDKAILKLKEIIKNI